MTEEVETELKELEKTVEDDKNSLQDDVDEVIQSVSFKKKRTHVSIFNYLVEFYRRKNQNRICR